MNQDLIIRATKNIHDILQYSLKFDATKGEQALVVYDTQNGLTDILVTAYKQALPEAKFIDFDSVTKEEILHQFNQLKANDLVVLVQSSNFRLDDFRIRIHLFQKKLKVIEHMHLYRNDPKVWDVYIDSLAYDPEWFQKIGNGLKTKLQEAKQLIIRGGESTLTILGPLEIPKLNIGDYTDMENIGGTFPIGEVFTEAKSFEDMHGSLQIYAFANQDFSVSMHEPFQIDIANSLITNCSENTPEGFRRILELVKTYERPIIREIGLGLNQAITRERYLNDITAFERIYGLHVSLGEKHSVYKKAGIKTNKSKFHVDLFPVVESMATDKEIVFSDGRYHY